MLNNKYIMLWWLVTWAIVASVFSMTLANWGSWSAIIAATVAVITAIVISVRWYLRRGLLKDPISITYLIPKREYQNAQFEGADIGEKYPTELTIGIGSYRIMYRMFSKIDITVGDILLMFDGPEENKPKDFGLDNPFIVEVVESRNGARYRDWWGIVHASPETPFFRKNKYKTRGYRIQSYGAWQGETVLYLPVQEGNSVEKRFTLTVTENWKEDEIPFLKLKEQF